jgi:CTP:molybdopterin cytidylyltransferase MocA
MIRAIVLAAGASSRMGSAKAALLLGQTGETLAARVVRTLLDGGVPDVTVVAGAHIDAVRRAMPRHERRARVIEHPGWEDGQLSSLLAGLAAIDDPLLEAALVTLVDVPLVRPETVAAVITAWRRTRAPIVRPAQHDRHGHPVIFDRAVFADLRAADPREGAKAIFARYRDHILNVGVDDEGAFTDIDTPGDYQRIVSRRAESPGRGSA